MALRLLRSTIFCTLACAAGASHAAVSDTERDALLAQHNQIRSAALPSAANMTCLTWDADLETVAQNWATQCNFFHNPNRGSAYAALSTNTGQVGENIYITTASRASALTGANGATALWAAELSDYTCASNSCTPGKVCGHYTQLVWVNTRRVGCAVQLCATVIGLPNFSNAQLVVCDYNPAGNFIGQTPYIAGSTGSQCPADLPNVVDGLCSPITGTAAAIAQVPIVPGSGLVVLAALLILRGMRTRRDAQQNR